MKKKNIIILILIITISIILLLILFNTYKSHNSYEEYNKSKYNEAIEILKNNGIDSKYNFDISSIQEHEVIPQDDGRIVIYVFSNDNIPYIIELCEDGAIFAHTHVMDSVEGG